MRTGQALHRPWGESVLSGWQADFHGGAIGHSFACFPRVDLQIQLSVQKPLLIGERAAITTNEVSVLNPTDLVEPWWPRGL